MNPQSRRPLFYGWVVVAVSFLIALVGYGMRYAFSVFYVVILDEFSWNRADLAGAFSLGLLTYGIGAIGIGALVDRIGSRKVVPLGAIILALGLAASSRASQLWHFYLSFGVLVALGTCAVGNAPGIPVLSRWFTKKRGMALGIFFAGAAGGPGLASGVQYLISRLGWRDAYLALAVMAVVVIVPLAMLLLRNRPQDMGLLPDGEPVGEEKSKRGNEPAEDILVVDKKWTSTEWLLAGAMKTRRFWVIFLLNLFIGVEINVVYLHQARHLVDVGYSPSFAAWTFSLIGLAQIVGNSCGFISDRMGREITFTIGAAGTIVGIAVLTLIGDTSTPWMPYLYALTFGSFLGLSLPAVMAAHGDVFLGKGFGLINGLFLAAFGIGGAMGSYFGGYIFDKTGTYTVPFLVAMFAAAATCASMWVASPRKVRLVAGKAKGK